MSDAKPADGEAPKKGKKKLLIIVLAILLLAGGGGGAAWYFMKPAPDPDAEEEHAPAKKKNRIFSNLDPFVVNLADEDAERFLQATIVLEVANNTVSTEVTSNLPAVRAEILKLLKSQKSKNVLTVEGQNALGGQVALAVGRQLGWEPPEEEDEEKKSDKKSTSKPKKKKKAAAPNPVEQVHFVQMIVQ